MAESGNPVQRFLAYAVAMHLLIGLSAYAFPHHFGAQPYVVLGWFFSLLAALLLGGGTLLLYGVLLGRFARWSTWILSVSGLLFAGLAVAAVLSEAWIGVTIYSLMAAGVVLAPFSRLDLLRYVVGVAMTLLGALMLVWPAVFGLYTALQPYLSPLGALGLLGGLSLLSGRRFTAGPLGDWPQRLLEAAFPAVVAWGQVAYLSGMVVWGLLTWAVLRGVRTTAAQHAASSPPDTDFEPAAAQHEARLEAWMWLLPGSVALLTAIGWRTAAWEEVAFVVTAMLYNLLAFWRFRLMGQPAQRIQVHLTVFTLLVGVLLLHAPGIGDGFLALLALLPVVATRALGSAVGYRMLLVAAGSTLAGHWLVHQAAPDVLLHLSEVVMELLVLGVASVFGIRLGAEQHQSSRELAARRAEVQRLADIIEATSDYVGMSEATGKRIYLNRAGARMIGLDNVDSALGKSLRAVHPPEFQRHLAEVAIPTACREGVWSGEGCLLSQSGERIPVSQVIIAHKEADGRVAYLSTIQRDIRLQKQNEQALRDGELRFRNAFDNAPIGMTMVDLTGTFRKTNAAFGRMLGYDPTELLGRYIRDVTYPGDHRPYSAAFLNGEVPTVQFEKRYLHRDGHIVWGLLTLSLLRDRAGEPQYVLGHIQDITERKEYEQRLMHLANFDPLTDLQNRRRFQEELEHQTTGPAAPPCALLFLDLDQFKYTNDSLGHQAGDQLLRGVAALLRRQVGCQGTVARLGGDEFGIILPGAGSEQAWQLADAVLKALRVHTQVVDGEPLGSTASIGIALFPDHGATAEELLARADFAMYRAKEQGRNRAYIYLPGTGEEAEAEAKLTWEPRIREALAENRLALFAQPIWHVRERRPSHSEALLRMICEDGSFIPPGEFLPVAERFGLIHELDRWVVSEAIRVLADDRSRGVYGTMEVNLSGRAFEEKDLAALIRRQLDEAGVDPAQLVLEITETAAVRNLEAARAFIAELKAVGCRFAIDDFGAGFSSFSYLKHLPVDYLKLDGSYIRNLPRDEADQHLVRAMVEVARGLGMKTIAEFVQDAETLELLTQFGVDYAQGYFIGRPTPLTPRPIKSQP